MSQRGTKLEEESNFPLINSPESKIHSQSLNLFLSNESNKNKGYK